MMDKSQTTPRTFMIQNIKEMIIDVELARTWLAAAQAVGERARHAINRPLSRKRVSLLVRAMLEDEFKPVGDLLRVAVDGQYGDYVVDGQHRLEALVQAQLSLPFLVYLNFPSELFPYLDGRGPRRPSDILSIDGETHTIQLAAMASWVHKLERKSTDRTMYLDSYEIKNMVERHPRLRHWAQALTNSKFRPAPVATAFYWIERTGHPRAAEFLQAVLTGENLSAGHPGLVLRNRLFEKRLEDSNEVNIGLIFNAFDLFLREQKIQKLIAGAAIRWPEHCPYIMR